MTFHANHGIDLNLIHAAFDYIFYGNFADIQQFREFFALYNPVSREILDTCFGGGGGCYFF